jgi:Tol biopolymer transport system component
MKRKSRIVFFLMLVIAALSSLKVSAFMPRVVAVVAEEPEKYNLYLMDLDGKNREKIHAAESFLLSIHWVSPDGATVYFGGIGGNRQIGIDGKNLGGMMFAGYDPRLSPDGEKVVFTNLTYSFETCLYMMNPDGTDVTQLTEEKQGIRDEAPSWSPDRKKIVFTRNNKLWLLDLDSKEEQELAIPFPELSCYYPRWSPDGKKIAFIGGNLIDQDIYVMDLQTGETTPITDDGHIKRSLLWTPDGKKLVYSYRSYFEDSSDFYWIEPDGKNKEKLTDGECDYYQLEWLPVSVEN